MGTAANVHVQVHVRQARARKPLQYPVAHLCRSYHEAHANQTRWVGSHGGGVCAFGVDDGGAPIARAGSTCKRFLENTHFLAGYESYRYQNWCAGAARRALFDALLLEGSWCTVHVLGTCTIFSPLYVHSGLQRERLGLATRNLVRRSLLNGATFGLHLSTCRSRARYLDLFFSVCTTPFLSPERLDGLC